MMNWISKNNILIVGLGLMGGSVAKGLKRLGYHVEAIDKKQSSIDFAEANGIIDKGKFLRESGKFADLLFCFVKKIIRSLRIKQYKFNVIGSAV